MTDLASRRRTLCASRQLASRIVIPAGMPRVRLLHQLGDRCQVAARRAAGLWLAVVVMLLALAGCAGRQPAPVYGWNWTGPVPDGFYLVRSGDSLSLIGARLGIATDRLAKWNRLKPPFRIYAGTLLRVAPGRGGPPRHAAPVVANRAAPANQGQARREAPRAGQGSANATGAGPQQLPHASAVRPAASAPRVVTGQTPVAPAASGHGLHWDWPLRGRIVRGFHDNGAEGSGVRIAGRAGETIQAAAAGEVIYSADGLPRYGKLVIVRHNTEYLSAYGFARRLLVSEGDQVARGQPLAEVGRGPNGAHILHFEIRRNGTGVDPLRYLPPRS